MQCCSLAVQSLLLYLFQEGAFLPMMQGGAFVMNIFSIFLFFALILRHHITLAYGAHTFSSFLHFRISCLLPVCELLLTTQFLGFINIRICISRNPISFKIILGYVFFLKKNPCKFTSNIIFPASRFPLDTNHMNVRSYCCD